MRLFVVLHPTLAPGMLVDDVSIGSPLGRREVGMVRTAIIANAIIISKVPPPSKKGRPASPGAVPSCIETGYFGRLLQHMF